MASECKHDWELCVAKNVQILVWDWPINQQRTKIKYIFTLAWKTASAILMSAGGTSVLGHAAFGVEDSLEALCHRWN